MKKLMAIIIDINKWKIEIRIVTDTWLQHNYNHWCGCVLPFPAEMTRLVICSSPAGKLDFNH